MLATLAGLLTVAGIGWVWLEALRAREVATGACRRFCKVHDLQLLDDTVALSHLELTHPSRGRLGVRRTYTFEFSRAGTDRGTGAVTVSGPHVESFYLPLLDDPQ